MTPAEPALDRRARGDAVETAALGFLQPDREDHIQAAEIRNTSRRGGVQIGTIDALMIQLCMRHDLVLLSTDNDFRSAAAHVAFKHWAAR